MQATCPPRDRLVKSEFTYDPVAQQMYNDKLVDECFE